MRACAVSIDLDDIPQYHAIHGLPSPEGRGAFVVYELAVARALAFAEEHGIPLTLFVIASDVTRPENAERLRAAVSAGHEIGNHSRDHLYDLTRRSPAEQREQVEGGLELIARHVGVRPVGFRAPGYTVTDALLEVVAQAGHHYDSSVFPCPPYYGAKALALGAMALSGRRSRAILDTPSVLRAPVRPYRLGSPFFRAGSGMVELPIQVTRGARLPYIGTSLVLAGKLGARALTELVVGEPFINLELHGIDFLGPEDGLGALAPHQPDARVGAARKRASLGAALERLKRAGYRFVRLGEAARSY